MVSQPSQVTCQHSLSSRIRYNDSTSFISALYTRRAAITLTTVIQPDLTHDLPNTLPTGSPRIRQPSLGYYKENALKTDCASNIIINPSLCDIIKS